MMKTKGRINREQWEDAERQGHWRPPRIFFLVPDVCANQLSDPYTLTETIRIKYSRPQRERERKKRKREREGERGRKRERGEGERAKPYCFPFLNPSSEIIHWA